MSKNFQFLIITAERLAYQYFRSEHLNDFLFCIFTARKKNSRSPKNQSSSSGSKVKKKRSSDKNYLFSFGYNVYFFRSCRSNRQFGAKIKIKTLSCCFSFSGNLTFKLGQLKMVLLVTDVSLLHFSPSKLSFFSGV